MYNLTRIQNMSRNKRSVSNSERQLSARLRRSLMNDFRTSNDTQISFYNKYLSTKHPRRWCFIRSRTRPTIIGAQIEFARRTEEKQTRVYTPRVRLPATRISSPSKLTFPAAPISTGCYTFHMPRTDHLTS